MFHLGYGPHRQEPLSENEDNLHRFDCRASMIYLLLFILFDHIAMKIKKTSSPAHLISKSVFRHKCLLYGCCWCVCSLLYTTYLARLPRGEIILIITITTAAITVFLVLISILLLLFLLCSQKSYTFKFACAHRFSLLKIKSASL